MLTSVSDLDVGFKLFYIKFPRETELSLIAIELLEDIGDISECQARLDRTITFWDLS